VRRRIRSRGRPWALVVDGHVLDPAAGVANLRTGILCDLGRVVHDPVDHQGLDGDGGDATGR